MTISSTIALTYYIQRDDQLIGPFDLLSMIRKIKNGKLQRRDIVLYDPHDEPRPADYFVELSEVFDEEEHALAVPRPAEILHKFSLVDSLRSGWENFKLNQTTAITTGIFGIVLVFGLLLLFSLASGILLGILASVWSYTLFNIYLISLLRKSRMQLLHSEFYKQLLRKEGLRVFLASLAACVVPGIIPALLYPLVGPFAVLLALLPGTLVIAYFLFVPLVIFDRGLSLRDALALNHQKMRDGGLDLFTVVYGLLAVNIILPVLPVTMPITFGALCDIYERFYNEY